MLGFNPISSLPISTIYPLFVPAGPVGGVPNYQYPSEVAITADGINALFDTAGVAERRRRRLQESRRALGLVPPETPPSRPVARSEPLLADAPRVIVRDTSAADAAADRAVAGLKAVAEAAVAAQQRAERIRRDDGDVLMILSEIV